jgi:MerR family transcriptional regulator, copper efflux regulator
MNIGEASKISNLPTKTIRYYEDVGLVSPDRLSNGYRDYDNREVNKLGFIQKARGLGFSVEECRSLLALYEDQNRSSADVKRLTLDRISDIDQKIAELKNLKKVLGQLAEACTGDHRPDCPILDSLTVDNRQ